MRGELVVALCQVLHTAEARRRSRSGRWRSVRSSSSMMPKVFAHAAIVLDRLFAVDMGRVAAQDRSSVVAKETVCWSCRESWRVMHVLDQVKTDVKAPKQHVTNGPCG